MDSFFFPPPGLTDLASQVATRRDRRGRRMPRFRYLLDSRLFRRLCLSGQTEALGGFRASLERHRLAPKGGLPDLEMTPLGFLDVIRVQPPRYASFPFSKSLLQNRVADIAAAILRTIKDEFEQAPELQPSNLRQRVDDLRQRTDPAAHELFDLCLSRFVSPEGFEHSILTHLAFDALFRFRFPEELRDEVTRLANGMLLMNEAKISGLTKARTLKALWDRSYERILRKHPLERDEVQAVDQEIKPRTFQDFLAWEVIHHAILGYPAKRVQPVIAFTPDPQETLEARCTAHKTALRSFLDSIPHEELATIFRPRIMAWKPGWLVPCRTDGTFDSAVSTGELPVF